VEGLLIAEELRRLQPLLPSRRLAWRFPDPHTFVLPLARGSLWLFNRPPHPRISLLQGPAPSAGRPLTGFQDLLAARAASELAGVSQRKLDRVLSLDFAPGEGFVETPRSSLIAELTGRNCNLILVDSNGIVLGAAREIRSDVNRYREIVAGKPYLPPPPFEKLDPRSVPRDELREALNGKAIREWRKVLDGIGPELTRALARATSLPVDRELLGPELTQALDGLEALLLEPAAFVRRALELPDSATMRERERREELRTLVERELRRELELVEKRLADLERAREAAAEADALRGVGDLLLAFSGQVPGGASEVTLSDFSGTARCVELDPAKSPAANAQGYYERARKREARARQAEVRQPELEARREELSALLARLGDLGDAELSELAEGFEGPARTQRKRGPGVSYRGPHGFTVLVGRSARENDELTFKVARSRDVWLHVQGYHGSHVIIRAENREVPFAAILFAARLAAAYSKAGESENVPVDYTLRKNVWRAKGQVSGAVNFSHQKTVYVAPSRHPDSEE
jgi:predicted ribosome quality control (RQC) complex YloA/Tae2 family protein